MLGHYYISALCYNAAMEISVYECFIIHTFQWSLKKLMLARVSVGGHQMSSNWNSTHAYRHRSEVPVIRLQALVVIPSSHLRSSCRCMYRSLNVLRKEGPRPLTGRRQFPPQCLQLTLQCEVRVCQPQATEA